ncbi:MAG: hypothetical protein QOD07_1871 [Frankiaceae bacterium]|jgi:hypothetical protein|nr:hypothetical protein [Frankiaceae bacterium]
MTELERRSGTAPDVTFAAELNTFEIVLSGELHTAGLPSEGILVEVRERTRLLGNLDGVLDRLDNDQRGRSFYISKMIAAAAVGLFDAALNYLWNETVGELRRRVAGYDLTYFFDVAVHSPDRRKHLSTVDDLPKVDDQDLLRAAREMGLLSDVGYRELDHIRYMRNYASAAHPNQVQLTGLQLASWLETCIREVITLPLDTVTAETGRLLRNLRIEQLDSTSVAATTAFFEDLPDDRADALAAGLFGLYTDPKRTPLIGDNVRIVWPELWPYVSDDARYGFGTRMARFQANADLGQAAAARELLDLVDDGVAYLPDPIRAAEMDTALDALAAAHRGFNNFYNEPAPARQLEALVGELGNVPESVEGKYVRVLVEVFLGNGHGIAYAADPLYRSLLKRLDSSQARRALRAFLDPTISSRLGTRTGQMQWPDLLDIVEPKLTRASDRALMEAVRGFSGTPDQLRLDSKIVDLARPRRTVVRRRASS